MSTSHYFQDMPAEKVLRAALLEFEMDKGTPDDFNVAEMLPCYTCLRLLPDDDFYTFPSHFECSTMSWGDASAKDRACRKCDRKTGDGMKQ